jgi:hypothetical protein
MRGGDITPGITRPLLPLMIRVALLRVGCMPLLGVPPEFSASLNIPPDRSR